MRDELDVAQRDGRRGAARRGQRLLRVHSGERHLEIEKIGPGACDDAVTRSGL